jgi:hypothetical protein
MPRPPRRRPWAAIAFSAAVHALLLLFGWVGFRPPDAPRRAPQIILLAPPAESPQAVDMRYQTGRPTDGVGRRERVGERRIPRIERRQPERAAVTPEPEPPPEVPVDTGAVPVAPRRPAPRIGPIRPGLADGRLWVRPLPLPPQELAQRLRKSHTELVDSAVTAIVQGYLDSIASDPAARNAGLPDWTTTVAGKKFGLDSRNIYIAGLKIPAAVLALLPLPQGNIDQNRAYSHLMEMRADLHQAGQRAQNLAEFKEMIREMRLRKEREREFERNQRTAPPPEEAPTP